MYFLFNYITYVVSNKQMAHKCWKVHSEEKMFHYEIVQYRRCGIVHKGA